MVTAVLDPEGATLGERGGQVPTGLTYRVLDYWCGVGVFGDRFVDPGSGGRRVWTDEEWDRLVRLAAAYGALRSLIGQVRSDLVKQVWESMETGGDVVIRRGPVTLSIRS